MTNRSTKESTAPIWVKNLQRQDLIEAKKRRAEPMTDKTPPIEIPTAAELNAAGVSCGTCDKKIDLPAGGLKCTYYNASTPTKGFCHNHPKLRGDDRTKQRNP